jgi:hypothetical protein
LAPCITSATAGAAMGSLLAGGADPRLRRGDCPKGGLQETAGVESGAGWDEGPAQEGGPRRVRGSALGRSFEQGRRSAGRNVQERSATGWSGESVLVNPGHDLLMSPTLGARTPVAQEGQIRPFSARQVEAHQRALLQAGAPDAAAGPADPGRYRVAAVRPFEVVH